MNKKYIRLIPIVLVLFLSACEHTLNAPNSKTVNLANVHQHIAKLASDEFSGRGPLTLGEKMTIDYLAKEYKSIGLSGGVDGSFFQAVPMAKLTPELSMVLKIGDFEFTAGKDFTARTEQINEEINLVNSDLVFVGYGINAPEYQWNDYQGIDVKDKTVVVLVNDPGFATQDEELFTGNAMTYYGRWTYKYEEATPATWIVCEVMSFGWLSRCYDAIGRRALSMDIADTYSLNATILLSLIHI